MLKELLLEVGVLTNENFLGLDYTIPKRIISEESYKRELDIRGAFLVEEVLVILKKLII